MSPHVRLTREHGIQHIRIERPDKKNALTAAMYEAIADTIVAGNDDPEVKVILILGSSGVFTAGNDIQDFMDAAGAGTFGSAILHLLKALVTARKPLVAGVDGLAIGVGTTMLLHCDLVYAADTAVFRTPFVELGLVPEAASSLLAPRLMGHARAFELLCLGAPFDAARAREAGLVNAVVPANRLEATAREAALALAGKPEAALLASRALLRGQADEILQRIDTEAHQFRERLASPEARAAFAAFLGRKSEERTAGTP
jgi:enoyl-CoA hydratase/carnithine racemase